MSVKIHTLNITYGGALVLLNIVSDVQWYTTPLDMMNAAAINKLIVTKFPDLKKGPPVEKDSEAWLATASKLKLTETMRETAKKSFEKHVEKGAFSPTPHVAKLAVELGVSSEVDITDLLADDPA